MKFIFLKKIFKRAFSLIELSIVIIIISILLSGALSIATSTTNSAKIKTTNNNIDEIYKALKVYLLANNRLPCPAPITAIKASSTTYGESAVNYGTCSASGIYTSATSTNVVYGMVPVKDLGLSIDMAEDGYGSKLAYIVDKRFTNSSTFGLSASNSGLMTVKEITSAGSDQENTREAIFLIISHGANKSGAFGVNSATQNTASDDGKEQLNYAVPTGDETASIGNTFYYRAGNSDVFDDVVFYKTRNMMVTESNAFNIISCPALAGTSSGISYGGTYMTWGEGKYGQIVTANSLCPTGYRATVKYPTKRCNTFGQWQDGVVDPCTESNISVISSECTGGTITDITVNGIAYKIHTFTASGTFNCTTSITADILVVGGGGGGGGNGGGGGGGGGVIERTSFTIPSGNRSVDVGGKGIGNNTSAYSSLGNGGFSRFEGIDSAIGGGGGASKVFTSSTGGGVGYNGGSGGGGTSATSIGTQSNKGSGVFGQGSDGGSGYTDAGFGASGGGGGGKSSNGTNAAYRQGGAGGNGHTSSISGTPYVYSSGGGGGRSGAAFIDPSGLAGSGAGIGGRGSSICCSLPGGNATSYGSGGGGGGQTTSGGNGKEGIVIIRYRK